MNKCKIGVIGAGNMACAIVEGAVKNGFIQSNEIGLYNIHIERMDKYKQLGYQIFDNEKSLIENSHIIMLAIKPQGFEELLNRIKDYHCETIVSIAAGISINYLSKYFNEQPIIRAMPNLAVKVGFGATALCKNQYVNDFDFQFVYNLFASCGMVELIDEVLMNDIITVNGSTPAYIYYFLDCLVQDAKERGIDEEVAFNLLTQTFIGSLELIKETQQNVEELLDEVCSYGGTTIEAINTFRMNKVDEIIHQANENCINRAKEIGK